MPRFFFNFQDGDYRPVDLEGMELADAQAARREALTALKQVFFMTSDDEEERSIACHVRDGFGRVIYCAGVNLIGGWVPTGAVIADDL